MHKVLFQYPKDRGIAPFYQYTWEYLGTGNYDIIRFDQEYPGYFRVFTKDYL